MTANPIDAYARAVVDGVVLAGRYHRLACERHLRDRAREGRRGFPYRFDYARAERFFRFAAKLRHYKGEWAGRRIVLQPYQLFRLGSLFAWVHARTGRRRFRTAYNEIPRKNGKSLEAAIVALYVTFFDGEPGAEGYCLHPQTRVLMADLSWKELREVNVGDEVFAVDEQVTGFRKHRKMRAATVLGKVTHRRASIRITFADGSDVICSPDHRWLSQSPHSGSFRWRQARELGREYKIAWIGEPWSRGDSWDAGYLAGLYDGEGYLFSGERCAFQVGFSQKPGAVLDGCLAILRRAGFTPSAPRPHAGGTMEFNIRGLHQCLRLLGEVRPVRLWANAKRLWLGKKLPATTKAIERIDWIGYEDLIDIETTERTFVAEGLVSHNCIATKRDQAKIVWNDCKRLVLSSGLRSIIRPLAANLHREASASKLEPLGADRDSTDGLNPNLIVVDEFHAQKNRGLIDVMETATGARAQPLNFQITTAGNNPMSPCGDQHDYATKILDRVLDDETFFAFIAHADPEDLEGDGWLKERTWKKANPNYGISVQPADLRALALKARHMPEAANAFKQKRCNVWVNAGSPWLSMEGWRRGQSVWTRSGTWVVPPELHGKVCYLGIDMSSKIDLTAVVALFPPDDATPRWRLIAWCLTPEDTLDERALRDRAPYRLWESRGFLRTNPGGRIDQSAVRGFVAEAASLFQVGGIGVDPWNAGNLMADLAEDGFVAVEVGQNMRQMSEPSKEWEADVLDGLVDTGGNPLVGWCAANVVVQRDNKDNIYPTKKKSRARIDPIIAALIARKMATADRDAPGAEDPDLAVA